MDQKIKFIIIGLIAVLIISLLFSWQMIASNQKLAKERGYLAKDNAALTKKFDDAQKDNQRLNEQVASLNENKDKLSSNLEYLQKKYESVSEAKEKLVEELKAIEARGIARPVATEQAPETGDAYWAGIFRDKKNLELQLENLNNELKTVQINNEQLQREKSALELEINSLNRDKQDLTRQFAFIQKQVGYNKKMIDTISLELVGEKNDKLQIQEALRSIKNENTVIRRQLKSLSSHKVGLEKKLSEAEIKNNGLENRFTEMDILLKDRILQIDRLNKQIVTKKMPETEESVELPPIVVRPQAETPALESGPAGLGKILAINRDNNFVIIDLGQDAGAKMGDAFKVYNEENRVVGTVEVIEVRKSISACEIRKETTLIKVGYTIR
jgi:chromosome segregation ATPase